MESLNDLIWKLILQNELGGNEAAALRFSNASSKSGLSFGVSQLDITHNDQAVACLKECGFTNEELTSLKAKTCDWRSMSTRLAGHADIIQKYDEAQLKYCLDKSLNFALSHGVSMDNTSAILAAADYDNQYGSEGDQMLTYLESLGKPFTAEDILSFKLNHTLYGRENPGDCKRRYDNIAKVLNKEETNGEA